MALRIDHDGAMFRCTMDVDGAHMPHRGNQLTRSARNLILLLPLLSIRAAALPSGALPLRIRVGILVYEGVYDTEFVAPLDVFRHAATYTSGRLEAFTVAPHGGAVRTAEGLRFQPDYSFRTAPIIDWLIVPSGKNSDTDMKDKKLVAWIREVGRRAQIVQSNCDGAFLLGAAGLLDGKRATTYPMSIDKFAATFAKIKVLRGPRFVDDNGTVTSPGGASSFEPALYLLGKHFGDLLSEKVARELLVDWNLEKIPHKVIHQLPKK